MALRQSYNLMLAELVYLMGEENPDPQATTKEYRELFFTGGMDMVIKTTTLLFPGGTRTKSKSI